MNNYHYKREGAAYYPGEKVVKMDIDSNTWEKYADTGQTGSWNTKFHEEFHQLDHLLSNSQLNVLPDETVNANIRFTNTDTVIGQKMINAIDDDVLTAINKAVEWENERRASEIAPISSLNQVNYQTG